MTRRYQYRIIALLWTQSVTPTEAVDPRKLIRRRDDPSFGVPVDHGSVAGRPYLIEATTRDAAPQSHDFSSRSECEIDVVSADIQVRNGADVTSHLSHADASHEHLLEELGVRESRIHNLEENHIRLGTRSLDHDARNLAKPLGEPLSPGVILLEPIHMVIKRVETAGRCNARLPHGAS